MTDASSPREVVFIGRDLTIEAEPEETLLSCIRRAGFGVESTCNGRGACGACKVTAHGELTPPDDKEQEHLIGRPHDVRLACMARVVGRVRVSLSEDWTRLKAVFGVEDRTVRVDSPLKRIQLPQPDAGSALPYAEILSIQTNDPQVLNRIATWDWRNAQAFGAVFRGELLDVVPDGVPLLGAAVDVGTTSLSLSLFDLESGELVGRNSSLNPQTAYGGDVITRITYCRQEPDGLSTLRHALTQKLGEMLDEALGPDHSREQVYLMTVAANTTMLHILAGVEPLSLALAPFRPVFLKSLALTGEQSGLPIHPRGRAILLPGVSAYIGADIIAGLAAIDYRSRGRVTLFIDMGTNGEIVLIQTPDRMIAASCAMGPALEGMNISCGCRAIPGAIDSFALDDDLSPRFTTIGRLPAAGICGSGLIDLVASLYAAGLIQPGGAFNPNGDRRLKARMNDDRFHLTDNVFLTQQDIRQVQLAKGAVMSGTLMVLEDAGLTSGDVEEIIVAGAFGYHLDPGNLKRIGLLPHDYRGPVSFVGNSSLTGACFALLNEQIMKEIEEIPAAVRVLELSSHPGFSSRFIANLSFPVTALPE
ncbi:MAG: ASKHA domain-containing protein [Desulfomonile sp.]|nr:ASKHA domain-containing protein [Desulfomonile sp.]